MALLISASGEFNWGTPGELTNATRSLPGFGLLFAVREKIAASKPGNINSLRPSDPQRLHTLMTTAALTKPDIRTEAIAGITTFFTMSYIVVVNPSILATPGTGMAFSGLLLLEHTKLS